MITLQLASLDSDSHTRRTLADLSLSVAKSKRILLVTGAGISCSSGIPDFRSSDGLYALVKEKYPNVVLRGRDLFDASLFRDPATTAIFYTFISQLKQSIDCALPTPTHRFIKTLDTKKKLLRSYTQNIDGLEERVGLLGSSSESAKASGKGNAKLKTKDVRNVQLHGDIHRVRCMSCSAEYPCSQEHMTMFGEGTPPDCPECSSRLEARVARSARPTRVGSLRPAIVLYDEPHPLGDDIGTIQAADVARKPDMLIIMGTSLKVHGLRKLVKDFAKAVHATGSSIASTSTAKAWAGKVIFVNKTPPSSEWADIIDYHVCGDTDSWVDKVIVDWKKMRPADWEIQQTLVSDGDVSMNGGLKIIKNIPGPKGKDKATKAFHKSRENLPLFPVDPFADTCTLKNKTATFDCPASPGKRGGASSHYNDLESSPSKRRILPLKGVLDESERKLLFTESTNNRPKPPSSEVFDLSMQDVEVAVEPKTGSTRKKAKIVQRVVKGTQSPLAKTRATRRVVAKGDERRSRRLR